MLSEDEALLQLDRELDLRLNNLRGKRTNLLLTDTDKEDGTNINEEDFSTVPKVYPRSQYHGTSQSSNNQIKPKVNLLLLSENKDILGECSNNGDKANNRKTFYTREKNDMPENNTVREDTKNAVSIEAVDLEHTGNKSDDKNNKLLSSEDPDELEEAKDAIFDEFLDQSTQIRIRMLTNKVTALTEALSVMQVECKRLALAKQEASTAAHAAEICKRNINKQLQTYQQEAVRHQKSNKHLQERVKELTCELQTLRKELSSSRQRECEHRNAQSTAHAQLTHSRADNAALKGQIADLKIKHKDELDHLRSTAASSNARIKELERQQRNYCALVKKQELLIRVLNEQKANIGVAKAAACLEDKFLAVIAPLQPA